MIEIAEIPYWLTLAHLPKWGTERINRLLVQIVHEAQLSLAAFFNLPPQTWRTQFQLAAEDIWTLEQAKKEVPNNAFLAEDLITQGFTLIPLHAPAYSKTLKQNLKVKAAPTLLYLKGNPALLNAPSVAVVGSRQATEISLQFTDHVVKKVVQQNQIVVSGFAKGVDQQALVSALKYHGRSIIVLPQGILTFGAGINKYYRAIVNGELLVLSIFPPKAGWSAGLAMARNPIIYALAQEIYVAQSSDSGGTWQGAINALKKERGIYVRQPQPGEANANAQLIQRGGIPVDLQGERVTLPTEITSPVSAATVPEPTDLENIIFQMLREKPLSARQILAQTDLAQHGWTTTKLSNFLKKLDHVQVTRQKRQLIFSLKTSQLKLF